MCDLFIEKYVLENFYDLYFLIYIDIFWEVDDLRDKLNERVVMFNVFKNVLEENNKLFIVLKGDKKEWMEEVVKYINLLLMSRK